MVELIKVTEDEKPVLNNLMEKYLYEFSQWELTDIGENGSYGYEYLDCYFTEKNRFPYLIKSDGKLTGFVLVRKKLINAKQSFRRFEERSKIRY